MKKNTIYTLLVLCIALVSCSKKSVGQKKSAPAEKGKREAFFKVKGTHNLWNLEITGSEIIFMLPNAQETLSFPYAKPTDSSGVKIYRSEVKKSGIVVYVSSGQCSDSLTDATYEYKVRVSLKRKKEKRFTDMEGCGNFIPDIRLSAVWRLESVDGIAVRPADFGKELPYIDLHIKERAFTGFGGCNRMTGKLVMSEANRLEFIDIIATKMYCTGGNKESHFLRAFQGTNSYHIRNNRLTLFENGKAKVVFIKVI